MKTLSIIMPAYNEEKRIGKTLNSYLNYFKGLKKDKVLDFEINVIINNTTDRTEEIVKRFCKEYKELRYLNFKQGGKGYAIIEGFKDSLKRKSDFIGFVDSDLAIPPESYYDLFKNISEYDGAIASRDLKSSVTNFTKIRKITHKGFNFVVRSILFLPYSDTQCGAKLFRKEAIKSILKRLNTNRWAFDIDLLYNLKKKGCKIIEIPTIWDDKSDSKLNVIKVTIQMFASVIRLRLIYSPFSFIVKAYDLLPEVIKIHH